MMTPGSANALLLADAGYQIQRSVRTRGAYPTSPSYFSRTAGTPTNNLKWTVSLWLKQGVLSVGQNILTAGTGTSASEDYLCFFASQNRLGFVQDNASSTYLTTAQLFRDPSAWYHILFVYDSAQATASNRAIFYVNGVQVTALNAATYPTLNQASKINSSGLLHRISSRTYAVTEGFDGYLTDINFIDGQALTPASFGEINPVTGVWSAKKYAGTYGTNGFFLNFSDNSAATAAAIGKDSSGNGNNWTPNNISVTAGVTYDSMLDVPLGAGGGERGNYCVMNPTWGNSNPPAFSSANLVAGPSGSGYNNAISTMAMSASGYWYAEFTATANVPYGGGNNNVIGLVSTTRGTLSGSNYIGQYSDTYGYFDGGGLYNNGSVSQTVASYATNDVIMVAFGNGKLWWGKNGTWLGTGSPNPATAISPAFSGLSGDYFFGLMTYNSPYGGTWAANFGQRPFAYTPPTGFKALHTGNLPEPVIKKANAYFDVSLYTGNGTSQSIVNGGGFQPDLVWVKERSGTRDHRLVDSVRGVGKELYSSLTFAEGTDAVGLTSFNSNGYSIGSSVGYNASGITEVGWQWKANGAAVTNTAGSITSQVSAGVSQGFSVVTYTGSDSAGSFGHGLGVAPAFIIIKQRTAAVPWVVGVNSPSVSWNWASDYLMLNSTAAKQTNGGGTVFTSAPTSTVVNIGGGSWTSTAGVDLVAYCFSEVAGYSKFGSYTGNGSADGPFVFLGFRPAFVLIKNASTGGIWYIWDNKRIIQANGDAGVLQPQSSEAEADYNASGIDLLSNGFKIRNTDTSDNNSGATIVYAAFAEHPFKNSLAR